MKISFKIVGVVGWTTLVDETQGDAGDPYVFAFDDQAQETPGFGSASQSVTPTSNTLVTLKIPLVQNYSTRSDAMKAIQSFRAALKGKRLHIQWSQDYGVQYYPNGALKNMTANLKGKLVEYEFTFNTQDITLTQPTT